MPPPPREKNAIIYLKQTKPKHQQNGSSLIFYDTIVLSNDILDLFLGWNFVDIPSFLEDHPEDC